ncbi:sarcolemmal membrane-associated protein isoform X3 [Petromyzon marinus]|uniref:sarcolemmal membrane-associated protein isoform X3 n=1 Tax=Petromyzon marinus TaxID=7757 RepID=UPI003F7247EE
MPSALAVFTCRPASHPFQERHVYLDESVKIGRSVARCRPSPNNATFDCKVLSRNHALLWFENDKFYLQDTKSSNGTFVNNQRLSKGSEESAPYEILSGDVIQFGVDVMENSRRVTHSCIISAVKLFLPDGAETRRRTEVPVSAMTLEKVSASQANAYSQELYQISQCLKEALHREQMLEQKLATLQRILASTQEASESSWQALMDEDRLLSRLEVLESQLQAHAKSQTEESLRKELTSLLEDKLSYETTAKESLRRVLQEKLEVVRKLSDVERALSNTEDECSHLKEMFEKSQEEVLDIARCHTDAQESVKELTEKLRVSEERQEEAVARGGEERRELQAQLEELEQKESALQARVEALTADNDFTRQQLASVKARLEQIQEKSSLKEESASLDDRVDDLSSKINGSIDEEHVAPPGVDSCTELVQQIVQHRMILGISNDSNPSMEAEMNDLQAKLRALVEAAQRKLVPSTQDGVCSEPGPLGAEPHSNDQSGAVETLREELSHTRQQLCQANAEIQSLKGRLEERETAACEDAVSSCSREPGTAHGEMERLQEELSRARDAAQSGKEQMRQTLATVEKDQLESKAKMEGYLKQIQRLQELLVQAQEELSGLHTQQKSEREEAQSRLARAHNDNADLQRRVEAAQAGQHDQTAALQMDLRRAREELERLQAEVVRHRNETAALRQQVEARTLALQQQHQQEMAQLRADLAGAQEEHRAASLESGRQLRASLAEREEALRSVEVQLAAQQQRVQSELEVELGQAKDRTQALLDQVEEVREEAECWQRKFAAAQQQKEELSSQISHFQSSLDESRKRAQQQQTSWARIVPVMCLVVAVTLTMLYRPE